MPRYGLKNSSSHFTDLTNLTYVTLSLFVTLAALTCRSKDIDWPSVGGDRACTRYSPLKQINRSNASTLQIAWTHHTGDAGSGNSTTIECTPIVIGGVMFITTAASKVVALDADSGAERWKFDPYAGVKRNQ